MDLTIFYYFPINTARGFIIINILTLLYGTFATIYLLKEIAKSGPETYFKNVDRTGANRPSEIDVFGTHKFVNLSNANIRLHYVTAGNPDNQLMLFVHGFPECWYVWLQQLQFFSSQYHVVAVNMRGFGESDKPIGVDKYTYDIFTADIIEFLEELLKGKDFQNCILVAHDWGGEFAWSVAQQKPQLIERLVLINSPHPLAWTQQMATSWKQFFMSSYMFLFNSPYLPEIILRGNDFQFIDTLFGEFYKTTKELDVYKYYFAQPYGLTGTLNIYRAMLRGQGKVEPISNPQKISPETLFIWGRNDSVLMEQLAEKSAEYCDNVTVKYVKNGTHHVHIKRPNDVNKLIDGFLIKNN